MNIAKLASEPMNSQIQPPNHSQSAPNPSTTAEILDKMNSQFNKPKIERKQSFTVEFT